VKLVDPLGEMLAQEWETFATDLANAATHEDVAETYFKISAANKIDLSQSANVVFARDTRYVSSRTA
jgi:phosphoacetylglucosamine mutase